MLSVDAVEAVFARFREQVVVRERSAGVKADIDAFRALVACLLSAQSRDANTAKARDALFAVADTPSEILKLPEERIAEAIRPCGLYNTKARNLRRLCESLLEEHGGMVPRDRKGLMSLPGIGRKCADIMLLFSFGVPAIAVDTHVFRVCTRTGLAAGRDEASVATSLDGRAPQWAKMDGHLWLLNFGKRVCTARAPKCDACFLSDLCESPVHAPGESRSAAQ